MRRMVGLAGLLVGAGAALWLLLYLLDAGEGSRTALEGETGAARHAPIDEDPEVLHAPAGGSGAPSLQAPEGLQRPAPAAASRSAPAPKRELVLVVRDEWGRGIASASVAFANPAWSGESAEDGTLTVPNEAGGAALQVSAEGYRPRAYDRPPSEGVVVLEATGVIRGHVRTLNGDRLAGAWVRAHLVDVPPPALRRPEWSAETDIGGAFRLTHLPPGLWRLEAGLAAAGDRPALQGQVQNVRTATDDVVLVLAPDPDIHGRVTGPDGERLQGNVMVIMRGVRPDGGHGPVWSGTVAKDGTFVVKGVGSGTNILWAWTADQQSGTALTILRDVRPGTRDLHIPLDRGEVITGRLVDERGAPARGSGWLHAFDGDVLVNGVSLRGEGSFQTHPLPAGRRYDITVVSTSGVTGTVRGVAPGTRNLVVEGRVLSPLTGTVLRTDGSLAPGGIIVEARAAGVWAPGRAGTVLQQKTDENGRFSFSRLGDFAFVVTAEAGSGHGPARVPGTVRPGADVELRLPPSQGVSGRLLLPSGLPAAAETLWVIPEDRVFTGWSLKTTAEGRFHLPSLPEGPVRLVLETRAGEVELGRAVVPAEDLVLTLPRR